MGICGGSSSSRRRQLHQQSVRRKLVLVGDGGCGKTSLLNVFTRGHFPQAYEPTVFENYVHDIMVDEELIELSLWDTAGQEGFDRIRELSYADAHAFLLCFSVDDRDSLDNIPHRWLEEVEAQSPQALITLVALKCDLRTDSNITDPITYEEGVAVARSIHADRYLECSAMHNRGVRECFEQVARAALQVRSRSNRPPGCIIL
ncbi:small GTPase superfamily [Dichotomocladium elegans]|nr:small GTPase superfamily [Dichotomocladium elegans]